MKEEENELLEKLREVNKANSEYKDEIEAINQRAAEEADREANPFAAFTSIQQDIEKENQEYINNQKDLADAVENVESPSEETAEETVEEQSEEQKEEPAPEEQPKKKTSLQSLLSSAKNLKK